MINKIREPYYSLMYKASEGWNDHLFQVPPELLEAFAESIVRECIRCCANVDDGDYADITPDVATGMRDGALLCKMEIRDHFGVEECDY